ncbi:MAG: FHA domain-containing protein [Chloroflexi bacterium]|uniref:FHA domain-containing protein n=1 Tax=Candidatus Chlorohelix allophototropha TaxID=3003348 RepID=A0A8T7M582_9CHLR|nr:FHA domain-containing protein [Chloroflexota bacterium]WJW69198.1 FHA domain-containing protein [Chloroflexota bacterium L227-S17]
MAEVDYPRLVAEDGEVHVLGAPSINLGRAPDNHIVLRSERCSRHHAVISFSNGRCYLRDLDSKNGTYLNGVLIKTSHMLADGDRITIGGLVFNFEDLMITRTDSLVIDRTVSLRSRILPDPNRLQVTIEREGRRETYTLNANQWKLFWLFYQKSSQVVTRDEISRAIYPVDNPNPDFYGGPIETHVSRLRKALAMDNDNTVPYIRAIRGMGYKLEC